MCHRYHELLLKNTMLERYPRIRQHNIDAYNRIFQSGLPLLCFESIYYFHSGIMTYTKCFLSIAAGFLKFSLGSGGKKAEKPTEFLNLNIGFVRVDYNSLLANGSNADLMNGFCSINSDFMYMSCRSKHVTLKRKLIESAKRDNNGTSEGDPPLKTNSLHVDLMLTSVILFFCILRIIAQVRTSCITTY